ncbi:hypothetical protein [Gluconacetobacter sp.]|uniref:VpaChn25_0724 family phage protein n=1 Tax=Gluconacetobacter sp. TaxID=1935994 RepID=UPI0039EA4C40
MSVASVVTEDRRLVILRSLKEMANHQLGEDLILRAVQMTGRDIDFDRARGDLEHLERAGCVGIERLPRSGGRELWLVHLTQDGLRAAEGLQIVPGVARRTMF